MAIEHEIIIEIMLEAVEEQYIQPLNLALLRLTEIVTNTLDDEQRQAVAERLHADAQSCPEDVAGRAMLELLSVVATGKADSPSDARAEVLRKKLRLI